MVALAAGAPAMPTAEERQFVAELNQLSIDHSSAGFGHPGRLVVSKARRQLAFASSAWMRWPDLGGGDLRTTNTEEWRMAKVDPSCAFWQAGQQRYLSALTSYMDTLRSLSLAPEVQRELLGDLGFHMVKDFVTEEEEAALLRYWAPTGPVFPFGSIEQFSGRRWFNYGPILPRTTEGTAKSTLTVIPAKLGEMPPVVLRQRLRQRIRALAGEFLGLQDNPALAGQYDFNQMYVNYYDCAAKANIEFHHDNHTCMRGAIAGISLLSACDLQLRPLDQLICRPPMRIALPRRSLFFLSGLSRWHLQHGILHMPESRLSLTFRTVDRSCAREELWEQRWGCLEKDEKDNAIWPLVQPDGTELHTLSPCPEEAAALAIGGDDCKTSGPHKPLRMPRKSTVVRGAETSAQQEEDAANAHQGDAVIGGVGAPSGNPPLHQALPGKAVGQGRWQGFYPPRSTPITAAASSCEEMPNVVSQDVSAKTSAAASSYYGPLLTAGTSMGVD